MTMNNLQTPLHQISIAEAQALTDESRFLLKQFLPFMMTLAFSSDEEMSYEEFLNSFPEIFQCAKLLGEIPVWDPSEVPNAYGQRIRWIPFEEGSPEIEKSDFIYI